MEAPKIDPEVAARLEALDEAIDKAGGQSQLAEILNIRQSHISNWKNRAPQRVPAERVIDIERATGVSRHRLRPDIYPLESATA